MAAHWYKCFPSRLAAPFRQLYGTSLTSTCTFSPGTRISGYRRPLLRVFGFFCLPPHSPSLLAANRRIRCSFCCNRLPLPPYMHLPSRSESKIAAQLHESYLLHGLYADADSYSVCATFLSTIASFRRIFCTSASRWTDSRRTFGLHRFFLFAVLFSLRLDAYMLLVLSCS